MHITSINRQLLFFAVPGILICAGAGILFINAIRGNAPLDHKSDRAANTSCQTLTKTVIQAGPFDVHRQYRSMEGPYVDCFFTIGNLLDKQHIDVPVSEIVYDTRKNKPAMISSDFSKQLVSSNNSQQRKLFWLKAVKLEVLDEKNQVMPSSDFLCHWNVDVNQPLRAQAFPNCVPCVNSRLITLSQGQSEISFPDGYGVPAASDEVWGCTFQLVNRTSEKPRKIKHRCTMYFIKDEDLKEPITALRWYTPFVYVRVDSKKETKPQGCDSCIGPINGVDAPNNITGVVRDESGNPISPHWAVPPGKHIYRTPVGGCFVRNFNDRNRVIHAVWSHVHPYCSYLALYKSKSGSSELVFKNNAQTQSTPALKLKTIDYLTSKEGINIEGASSYFLEAAYNNTSGTNQDAMAVAGIFCTDDSFTKPDWALKSLAAAKQTN